MRSLSLQWPLSVCLLLLLWGAMPPTQSRFIAKRETAQLDVGVADPDTVKPSSESVSGSAAATTTTAANQLEGELQPATEAVNNSFNLTAEATAVKDQQNLSQELENSSVKESKPAETQQLRSELNSTTESILTAVEQQNVRDELNSNSDANVELMLQSKPADKQDQQAEFNSTTEANVETVIQSKPTEKLESNQEFNILTTSGITQNVTTTESSVVQTKLVSSLEIEPTTTTKPSIENQQSTASTQRSEDHGRAMQFGSSTESFAYIPLVPVTPMKLRPLSMSTTTRGTTTHTPELLAALLHASVTVTPSASHENVIEEEQLQVQPEKRAKFISDNSTNAQQLTLPNAAEVWSLAAMKMLPITTTAATPTTTTTTTNTVNGTELANDIEPQQQQLQPNQTEQHKEKNLLDWQQIMLMQTSQENHTELTVSTTLDATEAATQPTTLRLDAMLTAAVNQSAESNENIPVTAVNRRQDEQAYDTTTAKALAPATELPLTELAVSADPSVNEAAVTEQSLPAGVVKEKLTEKIKEAEDVVTELATTNQNLTAEPKADLKADEEAVTERILTAAANEEITVAAKPNLVDEVAVTETSKPNLSEIVIKSAATANEEFAGKLNIKTDEATVAELATTTAASLPTAEAEAALLTTTTTTTTTTSTTVKPGALNGTPNTNEMAMKAAAHENNENGDKTNDVDSDDADDSDNNSDDVINVSAAVSTTTERQRQPITVSTQTAGELSTTNANATATTTATPTSTPPQVLVEQLTKIPTATTTLATPTPTPKPTEIVQISNEVNLETITVKNVTKDNNLLLIATTTAATETANSATTTQINNNSDKGSLAETGTAIATTTPTSLLTDGKLNEHETSLETNNIGETAAITTTTTTVRTLITTEASAVVVNALDESTATTATTIAAAAAAATTAAKAASSFELYEDEDEQQQQQKLDYDHNQQPQLLNKTIMANSTTTTTTTTEAATEASATATTTTRTTTSTVAPTTTTTTEEPLISLLDDSTTTTTTTATPVPTTTTTTTRGPTTTTRTEPIYSSTSYRNNMLPVESTTLSNAKVEDYSTTPMFMPTTTTPTVTLDHMQQPAKGTTGGGTDVNVIIAITVSVIGVVALVLLVAFLYLMRKRQKQMSYGQRCRPVSLDAYSLDNVSVLGSVRRKGRDLRASKRTYGNAAFDDPSLRHNLLSATELGKFLERRSSIFEEFRDVPQIIARADEVPAGCEDKNRYANVIPLPETRVVLQRQGDDDKTEYINANYVRGPRDAPNYYIACQAPLETTTGDFWRMIWEQQSRVIVQATDLNENGIERCAEYLPPSVTLDNHSTYGDYQVTLKHREVKDKYAISTLMLKRVDNAESRELTHYWYKWPEAGVPLEEAPIIAMLLEARSSLKSYALEQANELKEKSSTLTLKSLEGGGEDTKKKDEEAVSTSSGASNEINGNVANKTTRSQQGPLTIHCSPGTGRTGTIIACDMAIRSLETPKRSVDIPQLVYYVRRGRASAVQTKEQYEFIYKVANMYATKITNLSNDN